MINNVLESIRENIFKVFAGSDELIDLIMTALLARGHVLINDVPGVGKTLLAQSFAKSMDLSFKRIQFTPDLLPSDILGVSIYNQKMEDFEFKMGPIFANVILADEINKTPPRTQSALLECMQERQVTVDGVSHPVPHPFFVIATQNPIEHEGTYRLPESQLDRFMMRLKIGYPTTKDELKIFDRFSGEPIPITHVASQKEVLDGQMKVNAVHVEISIKRYIIDIAASTREDPRIQLGASPRAALALLKGAQAKAIISGRDYVIPDDVKFLVIPVLAHRLIMKYDLDEVMIPEEYLRMLLEEVSIS